MFLRRGEFHTDLHRARLHRRGELVLHGVPDLPKGLGSDDVPKNVLSHRWEETTQQLLILIIRSVHTSLALLPC
jgi:hypothetical protein